MALSKAIRLANGATLNYHVVDIVEAFSDNSARVSVHGFTSKDFYLKAMQKTILQSDQEKLVDQFTPLMEKETPTKTELKKLDKLQLQINELADKINASAAYEDCIVGEIIVELTDLDDLSKLTIEKALIETDQFKLAKIVG